MRGWSRLRSGLDVHILEIEVAGDFFHDLFRHGRGVFDERADQSVFAKQIDEPRNAAGMAMHDFNGRRTEDLFSRRCLRYGAAP